MVAFKNNQDSTRPSVDLPPPVSLVNDKEKPKYQEVDVLQNVKSTLDENELNKKITDLSENLNLLQSKIKEQNDIISHLKTKKEEIQTQKKLPLKNVVFSIFLELFKITLPVAIVILLFFQHEKKQLKNDILINIISGEDFKLQLGLELLRDNYSKEHNQYYYKLIDYQIRNNVANIWDWHNFSNINSYKKLDQLKQFSFSDDKASFNLVKNISNYHTIEGKELSEIYENFYDVEVKEKINIDFINTLREGNIFLKNNKCIDSYLKFEQALILNSKSVAAQQGRVLSFNCAYRNNSSKLLVTLKTQEAISLLKR